MLFRSIEEDIRREVKRLSYNSIANLLCTMHMMAVSRVLILQNQEHPGSQHHMVEFVLRGIQYSITAKYVSVEHT